MIRAAKTATGNVLLTPDEGTENPTYFLTPQSRFSQKAPLQLVKYLFGDELGAITRSAERWAFPMWMTDIFKCFYILNICWEDSIQCWEHFRPMWISYEAIARPKIQFYSRTARVQLTDRGRGSRTFIPLAWNRLHLTYSLSKRQK